ncbi:MAG: DMT family transporter [Alphaproteobacteria bacterium]
MTPPFTGPSLPRQGLLLLVALTFFWGVNWPAMKITMAEMTPWTYRGITGVTGAIGLLLLTVALRQRLSVPRREWPKLIAMALVNFTGFQVCVAYAISLMASGSAAVLAFTMSLWATLVGWAVTKERPGARRFAGLALGMAGIFVLLSGNFDVLGHSPVGPLLMILGAMLWGLGTVMLKQMRWSIPVLTLTLWMVIVGTIPIVVLTGLIEGYHIPDASTKAWLALAFTVIGPFIFCYYAWIKIVNIFPSGIAAISTLLIPVVGVMSGAAVLGEEPGWRGYTALFLITGALVLVLLVPARKRA